MVSLKRGHRPCRYRMRNLVVSQILRIAVIEKSFQRRARCHHWIFESLSKSECNRWAEVGVTGNGSRLIVRWKIPQHKSRYDEHQQTNPKHTDYQTAPAATPRPRSYRGGCLYIGGLLEHQKAQDSVKFTGAQQLASDERVRRYRLPRQESKISSRANNSPTSPVSYTPYSPPSAREL